MKSIQQTSMEIVPRSSIDLCSRDAKVMEKTKPTGHHKHPTHWIKRVFRTPRKSSAFMYVFKMNDLWIVQPLKKTLPCKFNQTHLENSQSYYHNKPTQQRFTKSSDWCSPIQCRIFIIHGLLLTGLPVGPTFKFLKSSHFPSVFLVC